MFYLVSFIYTIVYFKQCIFCTILDETNTKPPNALILTPIENLRQITSQLVQQQVINKQRKSRNSVTDAGEDEKKKARRLAERLIQILQKIGQETNDNLAANLTHFKNKFNLTKSDIINQTNFEQPLDYDIINSIGDKSLQYDDDTTTFANQIHTSVDTTELDLVVYDDDTTAIVGYENDTLSPNIDDDGVEFRKADDNESKPTLTTPSNQASKTIAASVNRSAPATSKSNPTEETGKAVAPTTNAVTTTTKSTTLGQTIVNSKEDTLNDEDEIVVIRRIKGIWVGGHCRCNYLIRSGVRKIGADLSFILCIYLLLQLLFMCI